MLKTHTLSVRWNEKKPRKSYLKIFSDVGEIQSQEFHSDREKQKLSRGFADAEEEEECGLLSTVDFF